MIPHLVEKRSNAPLFAFIDLLFLLVAFMVLVLFFMKTEKTDAQVQLETVQQRLATVEKKKSAIEAALAKLSPLVEQFALQERKEVRRRQALAARDVRRKRRGMVKLAYRIEKDGTIVYDERAFSVQQFKKEGVDPYRKSSWLAFRVLANPDTPFGLVVRFRRKLLEGAGEFDTYWDNLTNKRTGGRRK